MIHDLIIAEINAKASPPAGEFNRNLGLCPAVAEIKKRLSQIH